MKETPGRVLPVPTLPGFILAAVPSLSLLCLWDGVLYIPFVGTLLGPSWLRLENGDASGRTPEREREREGERETETERERERREL